MFEKVMADKLKRIFDLKVTYDQPSESREQRAIFVAVDRADVRIRDGKQVSRVEGVIRAFAPSDELPFGYFGKKIAEAEKEDVKSFFFGPEENVGVFRNIAERKFDFTFLFDSQYDPAIGTITSINLSYPET